MRNPDLYLLNERTERRNTWIVATGFACVMAAVLSVMCGKPPPAPGWPPPPAVVDALPIQVTPTAAPAQATPAADPSPVSIPLNVSAVYFETAPL